MNQSKTLRQTKPSGINAFVVEIERAGGRHIFWVDLVAHYRIARKPSDSKLLIGWH